MNKGIPLNKVNAPWLYKIRKKKKIQHEYNILSKKEISAIEKAVDKMLDIK